MTAADSQAQPPQLAANSQRVRNETLAFLVPAAVVLVLGVVLTVFVRGDDLLPGEIGTTRWLSDLDNSVILAISDFLDFISEFEVAPVLFAILVPVIWFAWGRPALILFGVSGSLTAVTRVINLADRARPTTDFRFDEIVKEAGIYPSGHVVYGVLVFGMIAYLAYKHMKPGVLRTALIAFMIAIAVLMGPSRVVELDHWPADVVGSYLLSIPFLLLLIWIDRHPVTQPGGRVYELAVSARAVEDAVRRRLVSAARPGRHSGRH